MPKNKEAMVSFAALSENQDLEKPLRSLRHSRQMGVSFLSISVFRKVAPEDHLNVYTLSLQKISPNILT